MCVIYCVTQTRHVWYSVLQNCGALQTNAKMGEHLKGTRLVCKKYNLVIRIIAAFVGAGVGICGCVAFAKVYRNYNAAAWAALSAVFAIVFLYLHFVVRQDRERHISRLKFTVIMFIGISGFTAAIIDFVVNVTLGITHHESGTKPADNCYLVVLGSKSVRSKVVSIEVRFDRNQKSVRSKARVSSIEV